MAVLRRSVKPVALGQTSKVRILPLPPRFPVVPQLVDGAVQKPPAVSSNLTDRTSAHVVQLGRHAALRWRMLEVRILSWAPRFGEMAEWLKAPHC